MTVEEVFTIGVIAVLATAATAAIYLGLLNWVGAFYIVRCAKCHHLTFSSSNRLQDSCPHCRHPALMHPIHSLRHSGVRVVNDQLHY
jgi:DNA-directed RNA polymerase subunit RPC12/RpoP